MNPEDLPTGPSQMGEGYVTMTNELYAYVQRQLAELRELRAAHDAVKASFKHQEGVACRCVYCTKNADGLIVHAAEYELKWLKEREKVEALEKEVAKLRAQVPLPPPPPHILECKHCGFKTPSESAFVSHIELHLLNHDRGEWLDDIRKRYEGELKERRLESVTFKKKNLFDRKGIVMGIEESR